MVKSLVYDVNAQMKIVELVFSWPTTLTDSIVGNVVLHMFSTNQRKNDFTIKCYIIHYTFYMP